jgi:ubiquinone/menaquinone biosynthesis C-methylase UbiE
MLEPEALKRFYDRVGARQDRQAFYEDPALDDLLRHAEFAAAKSVVEFGCGTGRFAERILAAGPARYVGFDISTTMVELASARLQHRRARAQVKLLEPGTVRLPVQSRSADRLVSTYVLDLLPEQQISELLIDAQRILAPGGRLCLVSITAGPTVSSRVVMGLWNVLFRLRPAIVGGCRPIHLQPFLAGHPWAVAHHRVLASWGVASEVLVATLPNPRVKLACATK